MSITTLVDKKVVFVAMSGGVDSSVAAALIKKRGFDVTGVFFKPWSPEHEVCCDWKEERLDAMRVCAKLEVPFKTWDFSKEYKKTVVDYMVAAYKSGLTPNPDVMCNKEIKFGLFLKKALHEGADFIATGHYIKVQRSKLKSQNDNSKSKSIFRLVRAKDKNKDQSYFLWTLKQEQLRYCIFPIGDYLKPEVRGLAKKLGLPNHEKKDSQGVCFVGQFDMKNFLKKYIKPRKGEIKLLGSEKVLGWHDGAFYYTIGQRHGLDIGDGGGPYFVAAKDIRKNIIWVTLRQSDLARPRQVALAGNISWIGEKPKLPQKVSVKIRYRSKNIPAVLNSGSRGLIRIKFLTPARAVTPGQSAVFYRGRTMLGGGIIR